MSLCEFTSCGIKRKICLALLLVSFMAIILVIRRLDQFDSASVPILPKQSKRVTRAAYCKTIITVDPLAEAEDNADEFEENADVGSAQGVSAVQTIAKKHRRRTSAGTQRSSPNEASQAQKGIPIADDKTKAGENPDATNSQARTNTTQTVMPDISDENNSTTQTRAKTHRRRRSSKITEIGGSRGWAAEETWEKEGQNLQPQELHPDQLEAEDQTRSKTDANLGNVSAEARETHEANDLQAQGFHPINLEAEDSARGQIVTNGANDYTAQNSARTQRNISANIINAAAERLSFEDASQEEKRLHITEENYEPQNFQGVQSDDLEAEDPPRGSNRSSSPKRRLYIRPRDDYGYAYYYQLTNSYYYYQHARTTKPKMHHPNVNFQGELSNTKKCLQFIHIPKTGGTSIELAFERLRTNMSKRWRNDARYKYGWGKFDTSLKCRRENFDTRRRCKKEMTKKFCQINKQHCGIWHMPPSGDATLATSYQRCDTFCVVRNPVHRLISEYKWWMSRTKKEPSKYCNQNRFNSWFQERFRDLKQGRNWLHGDCHFVPQQFYVFSNRPKTNVQYCRHIIRFEALEASFNALMKHYGYPLVLPKTREKNTRSECKLLLPGSMHKQVLQLYGRDFELLHYKTNSTGK